VTRRTAIGGAALAASSPALLLGRKPGDKPNLLFLWTDQQRWDTLAAYGNTRYRVPALNRLASESVVFDKAYVTQPVCTPSRSSVMTGTWPHQNGCLNNNIPLRKDVPTIPERLADSSYRTGYFGKWHLGDEVFAQRGFAEWESIEDIYTQHFSEARNREARSSYHDYLLRLGYRPNEQNLFTRDFATQLPVAHSKPSFLAERASSFILQHRAEPWMLFVNTLEPHTPFSSVLNDLHGPGEAPLRNFPGEPDPDRETEWYVRRRAKLRTAPTGESRGFDTSTRAGFERIARNYAGLCSLVDQAMGRILWALEASGQAENTVVVFTSDHGEMLGAHWLLYKSVMYEESVRVPLLIRAPFRNQKPMRVMQPVSHIDLAPTVLDLLGRRDRCDGLPGESHVGLLEGRKKADDHVFSEWHASKEPEGASPSGRTVISPDGWKLIDYEGDRPMLFHREKDPLEMQNLIGRPEGREAEARLRKRLEIRRAKETQI
jgi:arylsulfatase